VVARQHVDLDIYFTTKELDGLGGVHGRNISVDVESMSSLDEFASRTIGYVLADWSEAVISSLDREVRRRGADPTKTPPALIDVIRTLRVADYALWGREFPDEAKRIFFGNVVEVMLRGIKPGDKCGSDSLARNYLWPMPSGPERDSLSKRIFDLERSCVPQAPSPVQLSLPIVRPQAPKQ